MNKDSILNIQKKIAYIANQLYVNNDYGKADAYNDLDSLNNQLSKSTGVKPHILPIPHKFHITLAQSVNVGDILSTTDNQGKWHKIKILSVNGINAIAQYLN